MRRETKRHYHCDDRSVICPIRHRSLTSQTNHGRRWCSVAEHDVAAVSCQMLPADCKDQHVTTLLERCGYIVGESEGSGS